MTVMSSTEGDVDGGESQPPSPARRRLLVVVVVLLAIVVVAVVVLRRDSGQRGSLSSGAGCGFQSYFIPNGAVTVGVGGRWVTDLDKNIRGLDHEPGTLHVTSDAGEGDAVFESDSGVSYHMTRREGDPCP